MSNRFILPFLFAAAALTTPATAEYGDEAWVYIAEYPRMCDIEEYGYDGQVFHVYVASGQFNDVTGVSFRVQSERFGAGHVQSVTTPADISIVDGDVFSGVTLSFSSRHLDHEPVLSIEVAGHLQFGNAQTLDVSLIRGGTVEPVPGFLSWGYASDCWGTTPIWSPPDTADVDVGYYDSFSFKAAVTTGSIPPMGYIHIVDPVGWTPGGFEEWVNARCGICPWGYSWVTVPVHVPKGIPDGTLNAITLQMLAFGEVIGEKTVVLRAVDPVGTEPTTWGRVKVRYR